MTISWYRRSSPRHNFREMLAVKALWA